MKNCVHKKRRYCYIFAPCGKAGNCISILANSRMSDELYSFIFIIIIIIFLRTRNFWSNFSSKEPTLTLSLSLVSNVCAGNDSPLQRLETIHHSWALL